MTEVKQKSALRRFLEQIAVPATTGFFVASFGWIIWQSIDAMENESNRALEIGQDSLIESNDMRLDITEGEVLVLKTRMDTVEDDVSDLQMSIREEFRNQEQVIRQLLINLR